MTRILLLAVTFLLGAGIWRLARWYWRPRLVLPESVHLERGDRGIHVSLEVENAGAGRSRRCRAVLVRCERKEAPGWLRVEAPSIGIRGAAGPGAEEDPGASGTGIPAGETARIRVDRPIPDAPGTYRLDIAVLNGEEKRSSYVVQVEARP